MSRFEYRRLFAAARPLGLVVMAGAALSLPLATPASAETIPGVAASPKSPVTVDRCAIIPGTELRARCFANIGVQDPWLAKPKKNGSGTGDSADQGKKDPRLFCILSQRDGREHCTKRGG